MDNQALLGKIGIIVTEIRDQYHLLSAHSGIPAETDIEICLANTRLLAEYLEILQKMNRAGAPLLTSLPVSVLPQAVLAQPVLAQPALAQPVLAQPVLVIDPLALPLPLPSAAEAETPRNVHSVLSAANPNPNILNNFDKRPVSHISQGISLNQRLLFIRALFNGSAEEYERTMGTLDNFMTEAEALDYLDQHIAPRYDWSSRETHAEVLKSLLTRRFPGS